MGFFFAGLNLWYDKGTMKTFTYSQLHTPPLPEDALGFIIPPGIGDVSWIVSKLTTFSQQSGYPIYLSTPGDDPRRSHQLVELLPEKYGIRWAGYTEGRTSSVLRDAEETKLATLKPGKWQCLAVNQWLESGRKLADWESWLPIDYHYDLDIGAEEVARADELLATLPSEYGGNLVSIYTSNRQKDLNPGWDLWSTYDWVELIQEINLIEPHCFVLIGADYDSDRTNEVAARLGERGVRYVRCLGETLGTALECMRQSRFGVFYPSGIGILADVLNVPGVMLLPHVLRRMSGTYADPEHLKKGTYLAWATPAVDGVLRWVENFLNA